MERVKIGVIDIGLGNVNSVVRGLRSLKADVALVKTPADLSAVDKIIFPGVGNFGEAATKIASLGFRDSIRDEVLKNEKPILGICLGMHLLGTGSEEGSGDGLGFLPCPVKKLDVDEQKLALPHIGWNDVSHSSMEMFAGIPSETSFYFVHTYGIAPEVEDCQIATCTYGADFAAAVQYGRVWGAQFHPEKSQEAGMKLLQNFINHSS